MAHTMVQHVFNNVSGLAADGIVNTFHFDSPATLTEAPALQLAQEVIDFYELSGDGTQVPIRNYIYTDVLDPTRRHTVKVYNMGDAAPRVPVAVLEGGATGNNSNAGLPSEVAMCLSYQGEPVSGVNRARQRGRIYLGPLSSNAVSVGVGSQVRPASVFIGAALAAGGGLKSGASTLGHIWCVFSKTTEAANVPGGDFGLFPIREFSVDDAFDTIRSRGPAPVARFRSAVL